MSAEDRGLWATDLPLDAQPQLPPTGFEEREPFPLLALPSLEDGEPISCSEAGGPDVEALEEAGAEGRRWAAPQVLSLVSG